jgi:hypothetical protein
LLNYSKPEKNNKKENNQEMENGEFIERNLNQKLARLNEELDTLGSELGEQRFRLEKVHCDLVLSMDPAILAMIASNNSSVVCERCDAP